VKLAPAIAAVTALAAATGVHANAGKLPFSCPRDAIVENSDSPQVVERAVLRLIPTEYASLESMGSPAWGHAVVVGVVSTRRRFYAPQPPLRGLAVRLCGAAVADLSWTVFLEFPECQTVCSEDVALAARTPHGWRLWYSEFRHP
jgi:hypothetical protein